MAKFRYHRGGLAESMETVIEVSSKQDLIDKMEPDIFGEKPAAEQITVEPYCMDGSGKPVYDDRIDWYTYVVTKINPKGEAWVVGFTNGPLE